MITAGTVSAYLTLSTSDFKKGITDAIGMLSALDVAGRTGVGGMGLFQGSINAAAALLKGNYSPALHMAAQVTASSGGLMASTIFSAAATIYDCFNRSSRSATTSGGIISSAMQNTAAAVRSGMSSAASSVGLLSSAQGMASSISKNIANSIMTPLSGLKTRASSAMREVGNGMVSGLSAKSSAVIAKAKSIANSVASVMRSALGIASPSKVMRVIGSQTAEGMALGISDMEREVTMRSLRLAEGAILSASSVKGGRIDIPVSTVLTAGAAQTQTVRHGESDSLASLVERMDTLMDYISRSEQVMQVDGRSFGRLVREYV